MKLLKLLQSVSEVPLPTTRFDVANAFKSNATRSVRDLGMNGKFNFLNIYFVTSYITVF